MKVTKINFLQEEDYAKRILELTADTMFVLEHDGTCVDIKFNGRQYLFQDEQAEIGKNIYDFLPKETAVSFKAEMESTIKTGIPSSKNYELRQVSTRHFFKCILNVFDEKHILCQYRDITERSLIKAELEKKNQELYEIEKIAQIGRWKYYADTKMFEYSGHTGILCDSDTLFAVSYEQYFNMVHPEDKLTVEKWLMDNVTETCNDIIEYRLIAQGAITHIRGKVISHDYGNNCHIMEGYVQNITNIFRRKKKLELVTNAINYATEEIFALKSDGTICFYNKKFQESHSNNDSEDLIGKKIFELSTSNISEEQIKEYISQIRTHKSYNFTVTNPFNNNADVWTIDCKAYSILDLDGEENFWILSRDISDIIKFEREISDLNKIMDMVLENIPMNIFVKDAGNDFKIIYQNERSKSFRPLREDIQNGTDVKKVIDNRIALYREEDEEVLRTGQEHRSIYENIDKDGSIRITDELKILASNETNTPLIIGVGWDITERIVLERELIKAKEIAEQSDKLKSAFLANMSHEIRTPLNAILGFSRIIAETDELQERQDYYEVVQANNDRLLQLINEILDLSKIESGIVEFTFAPLDVTLFCEEVFSSLQFRCSENVKLIFEKSDEHLTINSDKNRLFQVFSNLIGNAIKFTLKGSIRYGYKRVDNEIEFYVKDTGMGIAPDKLKSIFERFVKINSFAQGTGLGLSICKLIIEKLGGSIQANSEPGKGTIFTFTLPYTVPDENSCKDKNELIIETKSKLKKTVDATILIAEDTQSNFDLLQAMIGKSYTLVHAKDGIEAIHLYEKSHPSLVLMDIKMPNMDGLDATMIIRELSSSIPIIALSAFAYDEDINKAIQCGCNEFITKPISLEKLKQTLNKYL